MAAGSPACRGFIDNSLNNQRVRIYLSHKGTENKRGVGIMAAVDQPPPHEESAVSPATTQLEFNQAMQDFKTMFPEMDEDVIEAVLRANQGAVDSTIDQLLTMSTDNENERLRTEMDAADNAESPPSYSPTTPPPSYQQAVPGNISTPPPSPTPSAGKDTKDGRESAVKDSVDLLTFSPSEEIDIQSTVPLASSCPQKTTETEESLMASIPKKTQQQQQQQRNLEDGEEPLKTLRNWRPRMLGSLPPDFLRVGSALDRKKLQNREVTTVLSSEIIQRKIEENARQQRRLSCGDADPELARYLEDERVALLLQNEEFVQELRRNKDFMSTLERDALSNQQSYSYSVTDSESDTEDEVDKLPAEMTGPYPYTKPFPSEDSDAAFREKLKNMGKMSRRKFAQLARIFSRRKKRSAKQILSDGAVPSRDNLLLEDDDLDDSGDEMLMKITDEHSKSSLTNSVSDKTEKNL